MRCLEGACDQIRGELEPGRRRWLMTVFLAAGLLLLCCGLFRGYLLASLLALPVLLLGLALGDIRLAERRGGDGPLMGDH